MKGKIITAVLFALLAGSAHAAGSQYAAVYTFSCNGNQSQRTGPCPNGGRPDALIQGSDGNFYGAAQDSMEGPSAPLGGTVFSLTPTGTITVLHTFVAGTNDNYADGVLPGLLAEGPDGKIYGETVYGGVNGCNGYCGSGVLYRVNRDGSDFQIIHKYCSETNCADGSSGEALVAGTDGNMYGTTYYGGTGSCSGGSGSCGTIFKVTPSSGAYEVVYDFNVSISGQNPSSMIVAADGTFYGLSSGTRGETLFHYTEATGDLQVIPLNFPLFNGVPSTGFLLTLGAGGNFYGLYGIYGTPGLGMFEVQADGSNLQLFPFYTNMDGGGSPQTMFLASDGNLWVANLNGIASNGDGEGNIITLSPSNGTLIRTLTPFSQTSPIGAYPAVLIQAGNGILWGSTISFGHATKGHFGDGTVFSVNAGLPPR